MRRTRLCEQILMTVERWGHLSARERAELIRLAERVARSRGSRVLGGRHLLIAGAMRPVARSEAVASRTPPQGQSSRTSGD